MDNINKIQAFLSKQDQIIEEDKEKTLITLGLTEKEYAPANAHEQPDAGKSTIASKLRIVT